MTDSRPSDRAIAAAFWEIRPSVVCDAVPFRRSVINRARELDATAAPSDILPIDAGNAADWLDRASSKWEHGPAAINPADALRLRSIAALLRATATPVTPTGADTTETRIYDAEPFDGSRIA